MVRNVFAGFLGFVALLAALLGVSLHWVNHSARDPQPAAELAVAIANDPTVHAAVATEVTTRLESSVKELELPSGQIKEQLTEVLGAAVQKVLANQGIDAAWRTVLDQSRQQLVADLDDWHSGDPSPDIRINLTPVAQLALDHLKKHSDPVVALAAERIQLPETMTLTAAQLDERITGIASPILQLAQLWQAFLLLAVIVLVLAVGFAKPRSRGAMLLTFGLLAAGSAALLRFVLEKLLPTTGQAGLTQTMVTVATQHLTASLAAALLWLVWIGLGLAVVGLLWWISAARRPALSSAAQRGR